MANYTSRNIGEQDNYSTRKKVGIAILVVSLVILFCLITRFLAPIRSFVLGAFGLCAYPILILTALLGVALMLKKRYVVAKVYIFTAITLFLAFICLFQLIFATPSGSYGEYLVSCYENKNTAGGLLMGLIAYALTAGLNIVGAYIFLGIVLVICAGFVIDHFLKLEEYKQVAQRTMTLPSKKSKKEKVVETVDEEDTEELETVETPVKAEPKPKITLNKIQEEEKQANLSDYEQKLQHLKQLAAGDDEVAVNIWGKEFIENIKNNSKPKTSSSENKTYSINELVAQRKQEEKEKPIFTTASRPARFVHEDQNKIDVSRFEQHKETSNFNRSNYDTQQNNKFEAQSNNRFDAQQNNRLNNRNEEHEENKVNTNIRNLDNHSEQTFDRNNFNRRNIENVNKNLSTENENHNETHTHENQVEKSVEKTVEELLNINLEEDNINEIIAPPSSSNNNHITNLDDRRSRNLRFNENRISNKKPEQIKIQQTQPTDRPTTKYTKPSPYVKPPISLLTVESSQLQADTDQFQKKAEVLEETLESFKIPAKVLGITHGPAVTRYELQMPAGIPVKKVTQHSDDLAMMLESSKGVRVEAPIPGKNLVGVEVPNHKVATIGLKDLISSKEFADSKAPLTFALGKDIAGENKFCDLAAMPHLLVAGSTGSGKSVCLNVILISLLYRLGPEDLKIILIDPKRVEFVTYNYLPHMLIPKAINEPQQALNALDWAIKEMNRRYELFATKHVRNFKEFNSLQEVYRGEEPKLPYIVIIIDEIADLMMTASRELEDKIKRLTQLARAAGIHLILATQRPSIDVITGTIKANLPARIAFAVSSYNDSRTIIDQGGAEKLLGRGDMLYFPQELNEPLRIQCPFVDVNEVVNIIEFIKEHNESSFDDDITETVLNGDKNENGQGGDTSEPSNEFDPLLPRVLLEFIESGQGSISLIQRRYAVGYGRAARIVDQMERAGFISPQQEGNKKRTILISKEKYEELFGTGE